MVRSQSRSDITHSAGKAKINMTPIKRKEGKVKIKRPQSAIKTTKRAKKLQYSFAQPTCPCQGHHHESVLVPEVKFQRGEDLDSPAARLSKSVSFNHQVKVREIDHQPR